MDAIANVPIGLIWLGAATVGLIALLVAWVGYLFDRDLPSWVRLGFPAPNRFLAGISILVFAPLFVASLNLIAHISFPDFPPEEPFPKLYLRVGYALVAVYAVIALRTIFLLFRGLLDEPRSTLFGLILVLMVAGVLWAAAYFTEFSLVSVMRSFLIGADA